MLEKMPPDLMMSRSMGKIPKEKMPGALHCKMKRAKLTPKAKLAPMSSMVFSILTLHMV